MQRAALFWQWRAQRDLCATPTKRQLFEPPALASGLDFMRFSTAAPTARSKRQRWPNILDKNNSCSNWSTAPGWTP